MRCPKCGFTIDDDARFCDKCGAAVEPANTQEKAPDVEEKTADVPVLNTQEESAAAEQQIDAPQTDYPLPQENQNYGTMPNDYDVYPAYLGNDPVYELNNNREKKKKKRKKTIAAVVIVIVLLLAAVIFGWQYAARAIAGEFSFYLWRESSNIENIVNLDSVEAVADNEDISAQTSFTGESGYDSKIQLDYSNDDKQFVGTYVMNIEDTDITFKLCCGDNKLTLIVPNVDSATYETDGSVDIPSETYYLDLDLLSSDNSAFESTIEASDILEILKNTEKNSLDSDCVSTRPEFVNGKLCNTTSITLDSDDMSEIIKELWEQCQNNEHVKETVDGYISAIYDTGLLSSYYSTKDDFIDSFYDEIDSAVEDMMSSSDSDDKSTITLSSSCTMFGNIVSRSAVLTDSDGNEDSSVVIDTKTSSSSTSEFTAVYTEKGDDDKDATITLDYSVSTVSDKTNGEISIKSSDKTADIKIKLEDITTEKTGGVNVITGKASISGTVDEDSFSAKIDASADDDYKIVCSVKNSDETLFDETIEISVSDEADMTTYEKAGDDAKPLSDLLSDYDSLFNSYDSDDYYYDYDYGDTYDFDYSDDYGSYGYSDSDNYGTYDYSYSTGDTSSSSSL